MFKASGGTSSGGVPRGFANGSDDAHVGGDAAGWHHRLPGLAGLRGIAIGPVLLAHYGPPGATATPLEVWFMKKDGGFGVTVFFVPSGFLIDSLDALRRALYAYVSIMPGVRSASFRPWPSPGGSGRQTGSGGSRPAERSGQPGIRPQLFRLFSGDGTSMDPGHRETFRGPLPVLASRELPMAGGARYVNSWRTDLRIDGLAAGAMLAPLFAWPRIRSALSRPMICGGRRP